MRKKALIIVVIVSIIGAVIGIISTSQHIRIQKAGFEEASFCAISEQINCDIVNASSYSEILGIPIAALGVVFYLLIAFISIFSSFRKERRALVTFSLVASLGSLTFSIYLAYIAKFVLQVVCIECISMWVVNIAIAVLLFVSLNIPFGGIFVFARDYIKACFGKSSNLGFRPMFINFAVLFLVVFLVGGALMAGIESKVLRPDKVSLEEKMRAYDMQSLYSMEPDPSWPVWGNPNAKVAIIEISDYQCPFCRLEAFNVKPYLQEFKDKVKVYFVNYPLDNACNKNMDGPMHPYACLSAKASLCAQKLGDFWGYHDDLFKNQNKISDELIYEFAKKRNWNEDEFRKCIESEEIIDVLEKQVDFAGKNYINATPTIIINNRKAKYWRDPKFLQAVVKKEIERVK